MSTLKALRNETYVNLETYRKNGKAVPTPVWFVEQDGVLYVRTVANSGKVKRVRNNPRVRVAACDVRGKLKGDWLPAQAVIASSDEAERANALLNQKYGLLKRLFDLFGALQRSQYTVIKIYPEM
ncbi:MAG: PPOX class F420-dependent oxidoreductase [Anaerolineae bacterium]|nr:PPOX class F420-dependent oxidoreductase [Thermoflexales bacterium]MDW8396476.1 PPOX class F420-dependent oxidoreductase [Anaerolineae bacterium]